jgi:pyrroloquinoline quinone biosynthesis protein D
MPDGQGVLLIPEGVVNLNASAAAIVELINGERTSSAIAKELSPRYGSNEADIIRDVETLLSNLTARSWLVVAEAGRLHPTATEQL